MCLILLIFGNDRSNVLFLLLPWVFAVSTLLHGHFFCICESDIGLFADKGALLLGQKDALSDSVSHFGMTLCQLLDHSLSPLALDWPPDPWFSQEISFEVLKADWAWKSGLEFHCQIFSERKSLVKSIITRAKTKYFEDHILMVSSTTELLGFIKSSPLPTSITLKSCLRFFFEKASSMKSQLDTASFISFSLSLPSLDHVWYAFNHSPLITCRNWSLRDHCQNLFWPIAHGSSCWVSQHILMAIADNQHPCLLFQQFANSSKCLILRLMNLELPSYF